MSSTLARRIRRIGILPSTFVDTIEERLIKNEEGKKVMRSVTIRTTVRNRLPLTLAELAEKRLALIVEARAVRKAA